MAKVTRITLLSLGIVGFAVYYRVGILNDKARHMKEELGSEMNAITQFQPSSGLNRHESYQGTQAMVDISFSTPANYAEVRRYYDAELLKHGWSFVSEKRITEWGDDFGGMGAHYIKGEFAADLEFSGDHGNNPDKTYGLALTWGLE